MLCKFDNGITTILSHDYEEQLEYGTVEITANQTDVKNS